MIAEKKKYIVCTIDESYVQHCGVMLTSLFTNNLDEQFFVYILTEGIEIESQKRLLKIAQKFGHLLEVIKVDAGKLKDAPISQHISLATYYRILIPSLIPENISQVLFLDSDLIVRSSISELWDKDISGKALAAALNPNGHSRKLQLNIPKEFTYFNAGVMLMNLDYWRDHNLSDKIIIYINDNKDKLKFWDQDALNANLYNQFILVSSEWNAVATFFGSSKIEEEINNLDHVVNSPKIVHFTGVRKPWNYSKPWNSRNRHPYRKDYFYYLKKTPWKNYSPLLTKINEKIGTLISNN